MTSLTDVEVANLLRGAPGAPLTFSLCPKAAALLHGAPGKSAESSPRTTPAAADIANSAGVAAAGGVSRPWEDDLKKNREMVESVGNALQKAAALLRGAPSKSAESSVIAPPKQKAPPESAPAAEAAPAPAAEEKPAEAAPAEAASAPAPAGI